MQSKLVRLYMLVVVFSAAILYGSTYQQFRFFDLDSPGGASDAIYYVRMSQGDFNFEGSHRNRWLTPAVARLIRPAFEEAVQDQKLAIKLSFYIVNFAFSLGACIALFALLQALGFSILLSLLGVCAYASSRITVLVTATPLVDAAFLCAIAVLLYLTIAKKYWALAILLPAMALSKETFLPFLLLPLLTAARKSRAFWFALVASIFTFMASGRLIDCLYPSNDSSLLQDALGHLSIVPEHLAELFTLRGIHDLQNGFSLLLFLAAIGAWLNARHQYLVIPYVILATVPIGLAYALLSGNLGRMFFAAFPAVIVYALISVDHVTRACGQGTDVR